MEFHVHPYRGCNLHYARFGKGPPVVMIQGVGAHGRGWEPQYDRLQRDYECLVFDNRGIGASQPAGDAPLTIEQMADDVRELMDVQKWDEAHVVGHSMGGLIALQFALQHKARVRSLCLLCTFADGAVPNRLSPWLLWVGTRTRVGSKRSRRRAFLQLVLAPDEFRNLPDPDAYAAKLGDLFGHDLADPAPVTTAQLRAMKRFGDATPRLKELADVPTLVASAAHDRIAPPAAGRALAAAIPGARFVELPDVAHGVPITRPHLVNDLLLQHLLLGDDVHFKKEIETEGEAWIQDA